MDCTPCRNKSKQQGEKKTPAAHSAELKLAQSFQATIACK